MNVSQTLIFLQVLSFRIWGEKAVAGEENAVSSRAVAIPQLPRLGGPPPPYIYICLENWQMPKITKKKIISTHISTTENCLFWIVSSRYVYLYTPHTFKKWYTHSLYGQNNPYVCIVFVYMYKYIIYAYVNGFIYRNLIWCYMYVFMCISVHMRSVQKVSSHDLWKADMHWRRYKIQETLYVGWWYLSPFQSRHLGPHTILPVTISSPVVFSWISSMVWNLFQRWF